jgi:hypothetical protein
MTRNDVARVSDEAAGVEHLPEAISRAVVR